MVLFYNFFQTHTYTLIVHRNAMDTCVFTLSCGHAEAAYLS